MEIITKVPGFKPGMKLSDIHGHVCIDLHNHNSGFTERIEADNVVTQALNNVLPLAVAANQVSSEFFPIATRALGGLMLFDGSLGNYSASDTDVSLPATAHLMGFAGDDTNTEEPFQGSFNAGESGAISGGYTSVWDFATNQANGTIGALARTHRNVKNGPGQPLFARTLLSDNSPPFPFNCSDSNNMVYINNVNGGITVFKYFSDGLKVGDTFPYPFASETFPNVMSNTYKALRPRTDDQSGFYLNIYTNQRNEQVYALYEVDCSDLSDIQEEFLWSRVYTGGTLNANVYGFTENHAYMLNSAGDTIIKVALSNGDIVTTINLPVADTSFQISTNLHGVMYLAQYGTGHALMYPDGVIKYFSTKSIANYNYMTMLLNGVAYGRSNYYVDIFALPYLGTVANLGSPVVKTATQSMKVTYTLTDQ